MYRRNKKRSIGAVCGVLACGACLGVFATWDIHTRERARDNADSSWLEATAFGQGAIMVLPESATIGQAPDRGQNALGGVVSVDFDHDGDADQSDYGVMQIHLGEQVMPVTEMDINRDGWIDGKDVELFAAFERKAK